MPQWILSIVSNCNFFLENIFQILFSNYLVRFRPVWPLTILLICGLKSLGSTIIETTISAPSKSRIKTTRAPTNDFTNLLIFVSSPQLNQVYMTEYMTNPKHITVSQLILAFRPTITWEINILQLSQKLQAITC